MAGGDGRISKSILLDYYYKVDLFDQCPIAVDRAVRSMGKHKACGLITKASMQSFEWTFHYSFIFMVWCAGYLEDKDLIAFLKRASMQLIRRDRKTSR